jgi:hypothetical protein
LDWVWMSYTIFLIYLRILQRGVLCTRSKARRIGGWIGASSVLRFRARCLRGKISQLGLREKYAGGVRD